MTQADSQPRLERPPQWSGPLLSAGLRACSDDAVFRSDRRALRQLANALDAGEPVESLFDGSHPLPAYLGEILKEGIHTNRFPHLLEEYLRTTRQLRTVWRGFYQSLIYPLIMIVLATLIMTGFIVAVTETMRNIFEDFGVELPGLTMLIFGISDLIRGFGWVFPVLVVFVIPLLLLAHTSLPGQSARVRLYQAIPIVGPARKYAGAAEMAARLAVLVEAEVLLHRALQIMGQSLRDANLRQVCRTLSLQLEAGLPPEDIPLAGVRGLLPALAGAFRWAREPQLFAEGLKSLSESFAAQSRVRADQFAVVIEPITVVAVGMMVGTVVLGLFFPLIKLLNELS